jgi:tetratricopeptide (TPR) repeat protein
MPATERGFRLIPRVTPIICRVMSINETREPRLLTFYRQYKDDQNTVSFVQDVREHYTAGTLERLARQPEKLELRRAAIFALGFVGDFSANHTVGCALQDEDAIVRQLAADSCRFVWNRSGSKIQRKQLAEIIRLNAEGEHRVAIDKATILLNAVPWLAEAWYQRGSAWFELKHFGEATSNCNQALELNPYHFVAATAMGEAYIRLSDPASALESFQRALRLNPALTALHDRVANLSRQVNGE